MARYGRNERSAEFILDIEPRDGHGAPAPHADLATWHDRFTRVLQLPALFAQFLSHDLGLGTSDHPPTQVGVWLNTQHSITELVDPGQLKTIKGAAPSTQFIGWALADPTAKGPADTALDWLTQLCDHALPLDGCEATLADIRRDLRS